MTPKKNRIPRHFYQLTGKMLIDTNMNQTGDTLHIYKNDCGTGYLALNTRTGKYFSMFVSFLRNGNIFELQEVIA